MPEIYVCLQNMRYKFGMLPKNEKCSVLGFKDFEMNIATSMEQNRRKLFGC